MDEQQIKDLMLGVLSDFKQEFLTEVNTIVDTKNQGLASSISKTVNKKLESFHPPAPSEEKPQSESEETPQQRDTIKALKAKYESDISQLTEKISLIEKERSEDKQKAFQKHRDSQVLKLLVEQGFEDASAVLDIFNLKYASALIPGEEELILYKPSEEADPTTLDAVVQEFKQSPVGKRWLPAEIPTSGADLPATKPSNPPEVKSSDPQFRLNQALQAISSGRATFTI